MHIVPDRCSPTLRYPECLPQSSSYPFPIWTSSRDRLLFALHGNMARSMPYLVEPFVPLLFSCIMAPFLYLIKRVENIFLHNIAFLHNSNDTMRLHSWSRDTA